jgi:hypothetical protein
MSKSKLFLPNFGHNIQRGGGDMTKKALGEKIWRKKE